MDKPTLYSVRSWEDLKAVATLEECVQALKAMEMQRVYHKTQYLKKKAILAKAKAAGITAE